MRATIESLAPPYGLRKVKAPPNTTELFRTCKYIIHYLTLTVKMCFICVFSDFAPVGGITLRAFVISRRKKVFGRSQSRPKIIRWEIYNKIFRRGGKIMDTARKKCDICGKEITEESWEYKINNNTNMEVCKICKSHIENLKNKNTVDKEEVRKSLTYIYPYYKVCNNQILSDYLKAIIESANSLFLKNTQGNISQQNTSSPWITGMRIIAWITFFAIIIGGIVMAAIIGNALIGFLIFIGSCIAAFLSVAVIMIFLDMAEDIKAIRNNTEKK